jgi:hypothetical protein
MKGKISISRRNDGVITLSVIDNACGRTIVAVEMSPQTLGECLTGAARLDVDFELSNLEFMGKTKELKTVWLKDRGKKGPRLSKADVAEGWEAWSGYGNHHYSEERNGVAGYKVSLARYVETPDVFEMEEEQ